MKKRETIARAEVKPRLIEKDRPPARKPEKVSTPGVDPAAIAYQEMSSMSKIKLNFASGRIGRFLTGKSKAGEIFHAIIDVLPIPNFHEVIKAVIKDHEKAGKAISGFELIRRTLKKLDAIRTVVAIVVAILLVLSSRWVGIDIEVFVQIVKDIMGII